VETSILNELQIRQGRMLAIVATILMPALIAVMGFDRGYPVSIIGMGLLIWAAGTACWLAFSWRWLKPGSMTA
jgi:hypothetical protein